MRKAKSLIGLNVISQLQGSQLGTVRDLIFDAQSKQLLALLLSDRNLFGLVDALVVPWSTVRDVGPHAVMVAGDEALIKAGTDPVITAAFDQSNKLDGKKITTQGGQHLGSVSDIFVDDHGAVAGYEVSTGLLSDVLGGKKFLSAPAEVTVGKDVILVPQSAAEELDRQKPGGVAGAVQSKTEELTGGANGLTGKVTGVLNHAREDLDRGLSSVKDTITENYNDLAHASVEKQKQLLVGKKVYRDVVAPGPRPAAALSDSEPLEPGELYAETTPVVELSSDGKPVDGHVLVRRGETITGIQAEQAANAGVLHELVAAALGGVAEKVYTSGRDGVTSVVGADHTPAAVAEKAQARLEQATFGKPAANEVIAPDGSVIVAKGQTITPEILAQAELHGRKPDLIAAAGLGAAAQTARDGWDGAQKTAASIWNQVKEKTAELTGQAHEKISEIDTKAEQKKIDNALGRPVTRVILDRADNVILNKGDIITNAAIGRARGAGILHVLLDSVADESNSSSGGTNGGAQTPSGTESGPAAGQPIEWSVTPVEEVAEAPDPATHSLPA